MSAAEVACPFLNGKCAYCKALTSAPNWYLASTADTSTTSAEFAKLKNTPTPFSVKVGLTINAGAAPRAPLGGEAAFCTKAPCRRAHIAQLVAPESVTPLTPPEVDSTGGAALASAGGSSAEPAQQKSGAKRELPPAFDTPAGKPARSHQQGDQIGVAGVVDVAADVATD